jgi:hypothetical protein
MFAIKIRSRTIDEVLRSLEEHVAALRDIAFDEAAKATRRRDQALVLNELAGQADRLAVRALSIADSVESSINP